MWQDIVWNENCYDGGNHLAAASPAFSQGKSGPSECHQLPVSKDRGLADDRLVVALVGLTFEARIAASPEVLVFCNDRNDVLGLLDKTVSRGCRSIISFGVAGGLDPDLRAGDWVVASAIIDRLHVRTTDSAWNDRLLSTIPGAHHAPILGVDSPVVDAAAKQMLHRRLGAAAVDMESHIVARLAAQHGLSFAAIRVIVDSAHRSIPSAALLGMRLDGSTEVSAVLRELMLRPWQMAALLRIAFDVAMARAALMRMRDLLGPAFGSS